MISDRQTLDNHFLSVFGSKHLRDIGPREIDAYKASKRHEKHQYGTGYSGKTINNHLAVLHRIFNKAIEYGTIDKNPVTKTSWLRPDRTAEDVRAWWTPDEEAKAMAMLVASWRARSPLKYLTLATQIVVGLRFSELRALEKRDLDLQAPGLWIRRSAARTKVSTPKNRRARFHVIPRDLAEELRRFMLTTEGQLLFPDPRGVAKLLTNKVLNSWYTKLAEEAGVRRITSHGARHTAGVELRDHGSRAECDRLATWARRYRGDRAVHPRRRRYCRRPCRGAVVEAASVMYCGWCRRMR